MENFNQTTLNLYSEQNYRKSPISYRPDIDGLRALAILLVLSVHFFPRLLPSGFIGVDIFFVISGFLITSIILKQLEGGNFSFLTFYIRRANRIFPALILVLLFCYTFGWLGLYSSEFQALGKSIAAGAGFLANVFFYKEIGYWDTAAELKPLLHLWSLGVEEQFYLAWPVIIVIFLKSKLKFMKICLILIILSFAWNLRITKIDPTSAFYLPFSRLWELLSGGMAACLLAKNTLIKYFSASSLNSTNIKVDKFFQIQKYNYLNNFCALIGIGLIVYAATHIIPSNSFPGKYALFPVVGTVLLILAGPNAKINKIIFCNRYAIYIGLISYPLYLWHWPILCFAQIIENGSVPDINRIFLILLSLMLASATYHLVEKPLRTITGFQGTKAVVLATLLIVCGSVGYYTFELNGISSRYNNGDRTFQIEKQSYPMKESAIGLLGDSHAGHLVPGLRQHYGPLVFVEARGGWPYLLGTKYRNNFATAKHTGTPEITKQAIDRLLGNAKIKTIIISNQYSYYDNHDSLRSLKGNINGETGAMAYKSGLICTIRVLIEGGKKVVYVKQIPSIKVNSIESCSAQELTIKRTKPAGCIQPYADLLKNRNKYNQMIDDVLNEFPQVKVFDTLDYMCDKSFCSAIKDGILIYNDQSHLNLAGSTYLGNKLYKFLNSTTDIAGK